MPGVLRDMKTRYIGFCPCCDGTFKVQDQKLVLHGYKRPGIGYVFGDCFGSKRFAHEVSSCTASDYAVWLKAIEKRICADIDTLLAATTLTVTKRDYMMGRLVEKPETWEKATTNAYDWDREHKSQMWKLEQNLKSVRLDIDRVQAHANTWRLKDLVTFEEDAARVKAEREQKKASLDITRQAKRAEQILKIQGRIDSAVRRKNAGALATIWRTLTETMCYDFKMDRAALLALVDRNDVWTRFDLAPHGKYLDEVYKKNEPILWDMGGYGTCLDLDTKPKNWWPGT